MSVTQENEQRPAAEISDLSRSSEAQEEEIQAGFIDRAIPFAVLIWPFSYIISTCQEFLRPRFPTMISNLSVLVGIIVFLLAVGWLSKRMYRFRKGIAESKIS